MTPAQVRMARAGLDWTVEELAERAGVLPEEVSNLEKDHFAGDDAKLSRVCATLREAGVEFSDDGAPGVRLRPKAGFIPTEDLNAENDD